MTGDGSLPVERLFDVPDGMVRRGDEIHDPENWTCCPECGLDCPATSETCFGCGEKLVE